MADKSEALTAEGKGCLELPSYRQDRARTD
jgi:hypothetical protein